MTRIFETRRRAGWLYALVPVLLLLVACGDDDTARAEEIVAPAIDACSRVGNSGDLKPCEDSVSFARDRCSSLSTEDGARCQTDLDELLIAAEEAYHLHHGECAALTSDAARSACNVTVALIEPSPTATPAPPLPPAATGTPPASDGDEDGLAWLGDNVAGATLAGAAWACSFVTGSTDGDACRDAIEDAVELCDRLDSNNARNDCRDSLDRLAEEGQSGNRGRGDGDESSRGGNNNDD